MLPPAHRIPHAGRSVERGAGHVKAIRAECDARDSARMSSQLLCGAATLDLTQVHCAIDGSLCSCCGGTQRSCPPGTEMSPVTWVGTCRNPADNKDYIISYNDCCGKHICGLCFCHRNEGDKPIYYPSRSNDINWCFGTKSVVYNCSTAIVLGLASDKET